MLPFRDNKNDADVKIKLCQLTLCKQATIRFNDFLSKTSLTARESSCLNMVSAVSLFVGGRGGRTGGGGGGGAQPSPLVLPWFS